MQLQKSAREVLANGGLVLAAAVRFRKTSPEAESGIDGAIPPQAAAQIKVAAAPSADGDHKEGPIASDESAIACSASDCSESSEAFVFNEALVAALHGNDAGPADGDAGT